MIALVRENHHGRFWSINEVFGHPDLTGNAMFLYLFLCRMADAGRTAMPSYNCIMENLKWGSRNRVSNALTCLIEANFIRKEERIDPKTGNKMTNKYIIVDRTPPKVELPNNTTPRIATIPGQYPNDTRRRTATLPERYHSDTGRTRLYIPSYKDQSVSQSEPTEGKTDGQTDRPTEAQPAPEYNELEKAVREQVSAEPLKRLPAHRGRGRLIDGLVNIICDVLATKDPPTVPIGKERKPRDAVQAVYRKLTAAHMEHVIKLFENQHQKIKNKSAYLRTMLYTAYLEHELHEVNAMYSGDDE